MQYTTKPTFTVNKNLEVKEVPSETIEIADELFYAMGLTDDKHLVEMLISKL